MFLEGLKSSVDVFFRAQAEPHPLQFLRSVSPQPRPEVPRGWGGPDQACPVIPSPWRVACRGTELASGGRHFPGVVASSKSPWLLSWARGHMDDPKATESIICWEYGRTVFFPTLAQSPCTHLCSVFGSIQGSAKYGPWASYLFL